MRKHIGIIFLIWFLGSLIGLFMVSKTANPVEWLMIIFGQYFLVFGIIAVCGNKGSKHFPTIILLFPLVGLSCAGVGIYMLVGGEQAMSNMNKYAPALIVGAFFVAGVLMLHMSLTDHMYLKKVCTQEVNAKCVEVSVSHSKRKHGGYSEIYMPTYSFWMNGEEHRAWNNKYSSSKFTVGEYYTIKVNPNDTEDIIDLNTKIGNMGLLVIGIVFIIISCVVEYIIFTGM